MRTADREERALRDKCAVFAKGVADLGRDIEELRGRLREAQRGGLDSYHRHQVALLTKALEGKQKARAGLLRHLKPLAAEIATLDQRAKDTLRTDLRAELGPRTWDLHADVVRAMVALHDRVASLERDLDAIRSAAPDPADLAEFCAPLASTQQGAAFRRIVGARSPQASNGHRPADPVPARWLDALERTPAPADAKNASETMRSGFGKPGGTGALLPPTPEPDPSAVDSAAAAEEQVASDG